MVNVTGFGGVEDGLVAGLENAVGFYVDGEVAGGRRGGEGDGGGGSGCGGGGWKSAATGNGGFEKIEMGGHRFDVGGRASRKRGCRMIGGEGREGDGLEGKVGGVGLVVL